MSEPSANDLAMRRSHIRVVGPLTRSPILSLRTQFTKMNPIEVLPLPHAYAHLWNCSALVHLVALAIC